MEQQLSEQELKEFRAFQAKKRREEEYKANLVSYNQMVDDEVSLAVEELQKLSADMSAVKAQVCRNFKEVLSMKTDVLNKGKSDQNTHTFTNSDSSARITLGVRMIDAYRDTVEDGVRAVDSYLKSLAKDENSANLVSAVMKLLAKNQQGQLKPSRVMQLRQMAEDSGSEEFQRGVKMIENSYQPYASKTFITVQIKGDNGWETLPLTMTEC